MDAVVPDTPIRKGLMRRAHENIDAVRMIAAGLLLWGGLNLAVVVLIWLAGGTE